MGAFLSIDYNVCRKVHKKEMVREKKHRDLRDRVRTSDFQIEIVRITQTDQLQSDTLPAELPRDLLFLYSKVRYLCAWCINMTGHGFIRYQCDVHPNCFMVLSA